MVGFWKGYFGVVIKDIGELQNNLMVDMFV